MLPSVAPPRAAARPHQPRAVRPFTSLRPARAGASLRAAGLAARASKSAYEPTSAKDAIQAGTDAFNKDKDTEEAVRLLTLGLEMGPGQDEAMAAYYNLGCVYAKQKKYKQASEAIVKAINDYNLRLIVALKDDDLRELRDTREWLDALTTVKGGMTRAMKQELRAEVKAPFRLPRFWILGGLAASAALGLLVIGTRLLAAIKGAPPPAQLEQHRRQRQQGRRRPLAAGAPALCSARRQPAGS
jgi:tetratricopeptide (TPR) repeat protein